MQSRERQLAENEVRFRALNERLQESGGAWVGFQGTLSLVCECGDENCTLAIALTPRDYEAVRAIETQFAVVPSHARPEVENVVSDHGTWVMVRKRGVAAAIAAATDPRS